jgi:coenzyme PQQ precursor peptide PqqA
LGLFSELKSFILLERSHEVLWAIDSGVFIMQWTAPAFEEVCLNCEINSYASAKL